MIDGSKLVFPSKRDSWLVAALLGSVLLMTGVTAYVWNEPTMDLGTRLFLVGSDLAVAALMLSLLYGTAYTVEEHTLHIASGPFRWTIAIDEIQAITPTRNPLSSPACSLDRL